MCTEMGQDGGHVHGRRRGSAFWSETSSHPWRPDQLPPGSPKTFTWPLATLTLDSWLLPTTGPTMPVLTIFPNTALWAQTIHLGTPGAQRGRGREVP